MTLITVALALVEPDLALPAALNAVVLIPGDSNLDLPLADAALAYRDRAFARKAVEDLLRRRESLPLLLAAGELALRQGDLAGARAHAQRALELSPDSAQAQRIMAAASR